MHLIRDHIVISDNCIEYLANFINSRSFNGIFVLVDENTKQHCLPLLSGFDFEVIEIKSGEEHKNLDTCQQIFDALLEKGATRKSLLVNLGGGVIGDMGGLCAALYQRGVYFINVPTTLLAMVDASVGGKLGVDYRGLKNYIGMFKEPLGVFIHPPFLQTLDERQVKSGFAEMIKHALVHDAEHFVELQDYNPRKFKNWITRSVAIKNAIVEEDLHENGQRKLLNFGHTIGHAVESYYLKNGEPLLHGEAIAIGMICEAYLSIKAGFTESECQRIAAFISQHYQLPKIAMESVSALIQLMQADKKNTDKKGINFTLLETIGEGVINQFCSEAEIVEAIAYYNSLNKGLTSQ